MLPVASGGVVGNVALSRWRPGPSVLLASVGLLGLADGPVTAVLAPALTLLTAGQFDRSATPR
jgi:hypothetical protein